MPWSKAQQIMAHRAAQAAAWNNQQRYIALRHVNCPDDAAVGRPSFKHRGNTQRSFELFMDLAEAQARGRGAGHLVPRPASGESWNEKIAAGRDAQVRLIERVWLEAATRIPDKFAPADSKHQGLTAFVRRMTMYDDAGIALDRRPESLAECDAAQLQRILEGLKKWVGREMQRLGLTPDTFDIPKHPGDPAHAAWSSRQRRKAAAQRRQALPI